VPKPKNNGQIASQKPQKQPRLSADDVFSIRTFVEKNLSSPNESHDPLPVSQLIEQQPKTYRDALELLAQGHSVPSVANISGLPTQILRCMANFIPNYHATVRFSTSRNLAFANHRLSEILLERSDEMPLDRVPFCLAVSVEKSELLGGGVSARTETRHVVSREELQKLFDSLPRARELPSDVKLLDSSPPPP
jgi:hypothetical protein